MLTDVDVLSKGLIGMAEEALLEDFGDKFVKEYEGIYYANRSGHEDSIIDVIDGDEYVFFEKEQYHLMQFTGLTDKNGKDVFEGDRLLFNSSIEAVVAFHNGAYGFSVYDDFISFCSNANNLGIKNSMITKMEVIGNIHDNPDLLT